MKKSKIPFLLRVVRAIFPTLERFFSTLADRFFVKIFFTPLHYPIPEKEKLLLQHADKFSVKIVSSVKASSKIIRCYSWGSGPVVLLVHGWAGRPTQFRKIIESLVAEKFRVVGFDGPAHGLSSGTETNIKEFEFAIKAVVKTVGVPDAIITHSFGGAAVLYAASRGLQFPKLINIASPTIGDEIIKTYLRAINGSWDTGERFKSYILKTEGKPFDEFTALQLIKHIQNPPEILLIHDENDNDVSIQQAEAFVKAYSKALFYRTKGLGHTRILKDDDVVSQCVTFVGDLRLR